MPVTQMMRTMAKRVLILGGTGEARKLANALSTNSDFITISSLAGRTDNPLLPNCEVRIGGFGGVDGLTDYLRAEKIDILIDATHPFAARISSHAVQAVQRTEVTILRIERKPWLAEAGDIWHHVQSLGEAVTALPENCVAFVTIGRQQLGNFLDRDDVRIIARAIEGPKISLPVDWVMLLDRPPFTLENERNLFEKYKVDVLVTKNAGGLETYDKLVAARQLQKPVIMIDRLAKPPVETYETIEDTLEALINQHT